MIVFEKNKEGDFELHLDKEGAVALIKIIDNFLTKDINEHEHLMTPSWGGGKLSEEKQSASAEILNKLTLFYWNKN